MNVPIAFYGKIINQDDKALPKVHLSLRVQKVHFSPAYLMKPEYVRFDCITDSNGCFSLDNVRGKNLEIVSITGKGYEAEPNVVHTYGPVGGTIDKPMTFRMWRQDIKEPLVSGKRSFPTVSDGTPYTIDFANGTITRSDEQNGDLRVWVKLLHKMDSRNYAWACQFRVLNGGLSEEKDSLSPMFLAPAGGYTNVFDLTIDETNKWNRSSGTLWFYLRLKNGTEYGRFSIDIAAYHRNKGKMDIEYAINPTGSRA